MFSSHYTFAWCTMVYLWRICMYSPYPPKGPLISSLGYKIKAQLRCYLLKKPFELPFTFSLTPYPDWDCFMLLQSLLYPVLTSSITLYHKLFISLSLFTLCYLKTGNMFFKLWNPIYDNVWHRRNTYYSRITNKSALSILFNLLLKYTTADTETVNLSYMANIKLYLLSSFLFTKFFIKVSLCAVLHKTHLLNTASKPFLCASEFLY